MGQKYKKNEIKLEKLQKEIDGLEDVLDEIDKLENVSDKSNEKSTIIVSLKNYVLFRQMSIFEFKIITSVKGAMDGKNNSSETYGKTIIGDGRGWINNLDSWTMLILSDKIFKDNKEFEINSLASFMYFFNKIIKINNTELKEYFKTNYSGDWFELIKSLTKKRNELTHDLHDTNFPIKDLRYIQNLMQIFCYSFERVLDVLMLQIGNHETNSKSLQRFEETSDNMSEYNAEFVKSEIFYNLINENYKKNFKITGTVIRLNHTKGFGFIEREGGDDMFVHKSDVDGFINEGDKVTCSILVVKKGSEFKLNAKNVKKIQ